ncbi:MAG TPA: aldo/keto reductase [Phycisphaerae bacterium]|nr:aldo/keto reductase [Phycisphaerae bacterium]
MQYRNLSGTDLRASIIGFGCASVLGAVGAGKSRRAMEIAFDEGINYFDIARSYGFGAAESFLGKFLRGKRDKICLASKFGILPPKRNALIDRLRPIIRPAVKAIRRLAPAVHQNLRQQVGNLVSHHQFSLQIARQSLEQSLRDLQTDHLDIWFLHECAADLANSDELFDFINQCVASGKVRYYGVASGINQVTAILRARPAVRIAQFASNLADDSIHRFENPRGVAVNTHSPFGRGSLRKSLSTFFAADPQSARRWSAMLDLDLLSFPGVNEFFLRYSIISNRLGTVICGMYSPEHIRANAAAADRAVHSRNVEEVAAELRQKNAFAV